MISQHRSICVLVLVATGLGGCTQFLTGATGETRRGVSSSLVDYLYPNGEIPPAQDGSIPQLNVPLRVGLAFVPSRDSDEVPGLSEADKTALLAKVRDAFIEQEFISEIEVIPETYLRSGRGFQSLEQVARLYQLDVMGLVSYDQVVTSEDSTASVLYWTIVGAYFIEGSKNDVQTFVDTAIFDIKTRRLLFRAPGINKLSNRSTLIKSAEELRESRRASFTAAIEEMTTNLDKQLVGFQERIKEDPTVATVVEKPGRGGGGSTGFLLIALLTFLRLTRRRIAAVCVVQRA